MTKKTTKIAFKDGKIVLTIERQRHQTTHIQHITLGKNAVCIPTQPKYQVYPPSPNKIVKENLFGYCFKTNEEGNELTIIEGNPEDELV